MKSADLSDRFGNPSALNPELDTDIVGAAGSGAIFETNEFQNESQFEKTAAVMKLVMSSFAGAGTIEMGGYDYHGDGRASAEIRDSRFARLQPVVPFEQCSDRICRGEVVGEVQVQARYAAKVRDAADPALVEHVGERCGLDRDAVLVGQLMPGLAGRPIRLRATSDRQGDLPVDDLGRLVHVRERAGPGQAIGTPRAAKLDSSRVHG